MTDAVQAPTNSRLVSQLTVEELRALWREDMRALLLETRKHESTTVTQNDANGAMPSLDDFPVDHFESWPEGMTFSREEMYDDDGR